MLNGRLLRRAGFTIHIGGGVPPINRGLRMRSPIRPGVYIMAKCLLDELGRGRCKYGRPGARAA